MPVQTVEEYDKLDVWVIRGPSHFWWCALCFSVDVDGPSAKIIQHQPPPKQMVEVYGGGSWTNIQRAEVERLSPTVECNSSDRHAGWLRVGA